MEIQYDLLVMSLGPEYLIFRSFAPEYLIRIVSTRNVIFVSGKEFT